MKTRISMFDTLIYLMCNKPDYGWWHLPNDLVAGQKHSPKNESCFHFMRLSCLYNGGLLFINSIILFWYYTSLLLQQNCYTKRNYSVTTCPIMPSLPSDMILWEFGSSDSRNASHGEWNSSLMCLVWNYNQPYTELHIIKTPEIFINKTHTCKFTF